MMHFDDLPVLSAEQLRVTILNPATCAAVAKMTSRALWRMDYDLRAEQRADVNVGAEAAYRAAQARQEALDRAEKQRREEAAIADVTWSHNNRAQFFGFLSLEPCELRCDLVTIATRAELSRKHMYVLREVVMRERPLSSVAKDLKVSQGRVSQITRDALRYCRQQVNKWRNQ